MYYHYSPCIHDKIKIDMHGCHFLGCTHPERKTLSSWLSRKFHELFKIKYCCAAESGYEKYCPFYNDGVNLKEIIKKIEENAHNFSNSHELSKEEKEKDIFEAKYGIWG